MTTRLAAIRPKLEDIAKLRACEPCRHCQAIYCRIPIAKQWAEEALRLLDGKDSQPPEAEEADLDVQNRSG